MVLERQFLSKATARILRCSEAKTGASSDEDGIIVFRVTNNKSLRLLGMNDIFIVNQFGPRAKEFFKAKQFNLKTTIKSMFSDLL